MTTWDFNHRIGFYHIDEQMHDIPKHPEAQPLAVSITLGCCMPQQVWGSGVWGCRASAHRCDRTMR